MLVSALPDAVKCVMRASERGWGRVRVLGIHFSKVTFICSNSKRDLSGFGQRDSKWVSKKAEKEDRFPQIRVKPVSQTTGHLRVCMKCSDCVAHGPCSRTSHCHHYQGHGVFTPGKSTCSSANPGQPETQQGNHTHFQKDTRNTLPVFCPGLGMAPGPVAMETVSPTVSGNSLATNTACA